MRFLTSDIKSITAEGGIHIRRVKTEEKAKVVAAVWGTEFIQFLAALAVFHQDYFEE